MPKFSLNISNPFGGRDERLRQADGLIEQGQAAFQQGALSEALAFYEEAFHLKAEHLGLGHAEINALVESLADDLQLSGRLAEAARYFEQSLTGPEDGTEPGNPWRGFLIDRLGNVLAGRDTIDDAIVLYGIAVKSFEASLGPEDFHVLYTLQKLVGLHYNEGDLTQARALAERVLAMDKKIFGVNHHRVAADASRLGQILRDMGDFAGAKTLYEQAAAINEAAYGPGHSRLVADLTSLSEVQKILGDLDGARQTLEHILTLDEELFGPDHPKIAADLGELADIQAQLGERTTALVSARRMLAIDQKVFGPDHPKLVADLSAVGRASQAAGSPIEAKRYFEQALALSEICFGPDHLRVAACAQQLGETLRDLGDRPGARPFFRRALEIQERYLPAGHEDLRALRAELEE